MQLTRFIRDIPDFPKEGIVFRDVSPLLRQPEAFAMTIDSLAKELRDADGIAALDARGFIFGAALAAKFALPLVLVRKQGKLPGSTIATSYELEYGEGVLEIQTESLHGMHLLVVDDLLATGGTAAAACRLIEKAGATVSGCAFVIELAALGGREKLKGYRVSAAAIYEENDP